MDPTKAFGKRGEYPVFISAYMKWEDKKDLLDIPGVRSAPGGFRCSWDAAPVLSRILGRKSPPPPTEENVDLVGETKQLPGLQRYQELGFRDKLRDYQRFGALFLARRAWAMNSDPMRCVDGATTLQTPYETVTIERLHRRTRYTKKMPRLLAWNEEKGEFLFHQAKDIVQSKYKPMLELKTMSGNVIRCTEEHKLLVQNANYDSYWLDAGAVAKSGIPYCLLIQDSRGRSRWSEITDIKETNPGITYDVVMEDPHRNYVANGIVVHNSGKSVQSLAGSVLTGSKKTLIVCPALAKYVWADEIWKWLKEEALILEGRAGTVARQYCGTCEAKGVLDGGERCPSCKKGNGASSGYRLFQVRKLDGAVQKSSDKIRFCSVRAKAACRKHPTVELPHDRIADNCPECMAELHNAIQRAKFVIVNYDLLVSQKVKDIRGKLGVREELPGWCPTLGKFHFDLCIGDELHAIRGWTTDASKAGQTRRDRFIQLVENIDKVWGLTGTPIYGFVRDLWGQLDAISGGLYSNGSGLPFKFHKRYCEGARSEYGWWADGCSPLAETELPARLSLFKLQRPRSQILASMPKKVRKVIRLDRSSHLSRALGTTKGPPSQRLSRMIQRAATYKRPFVVENVMEEVLAGEKAIVFLLMKDEVHKMGKALERELNKRENRRRSKHVNAKVWRTNGSVSPETRFQQARAFRDHDGAGVFIATIDSVQVAVSLAGAGSVHFADFHWQPAAMLQAEDRPYAVGITGLQIVYYVVRDSIDEHIESVVLPKIRTLESVVAEQGADEMKRLLQGAPETAAEIHARLTAHLHKEKVPVLDEDDDWDEDL